MKKLPNFFFFPKKSILVSSIFESLVSTHLLYRELVHRVLSKLWTDDWQHMKKQGLDEGKSCQNHWHCIKVRTKGLEMAPQTLMYIMF